MSKKFKKDKNIWDITVEEQLRATEDLIKLELGKDKPSLLDYALDVEKKKKKKKERMKGERGTISDELEKVVKRKEEREENELLDGLAEAMMVGKCDSGDAGEIGVVPSDYTPKVQTKEKNTPVNKITPIRIFFDKILKRATIYDGVVRKECFLPASKYIELQKLFSHEEVDASIEEIEKIIILLNHPTCILSKEGFDKIYEEVDFDSDELLFSSIPDSDEIAAYFVDKKSFERFNGYCRGIVTYNEMLQIYISLFFISQSLDNKFFITDREYIEEYRNTLTTSEGEFIEFIEKRYSNYEPEEKDTNIEIYKSDELEISIYNAINEEIIVDDDDDFVDTDDEDDSSDYFSEEETDEDTEVEDELDDTDETSEENGTDEVEETTSDTSNDELIPEAEKVEVRDEPKKEEPKKSDSDKNNNSGKNEEEDLVIPRIN